ncbi:MAG: hypothetical protein AAGF11_44135 [Myxococcota bacterium]
MASPLVLPDVLPAPAPFDEAGGVLPPGAPTADGRITELVAIDDDRAIVRFVVPGEHWERKWWIALMTRDGSLQWLQALSGRLDRLGRGSSIQLVGDARRGGDPARRRAAPPRGVPHGSAWA